MLRKNISRPVQSSLLISLAMLATGSVASANAPSTESCAAQITGRFIESAPRDRFTFANSPTSRWSVRNITIELGAADGNLVFDTENGGAGVEVFQPYRLEDSSAAVTDVTLPDDGGQSIKIQFSEFQPGQEYTFSIDVDDQLTDSALGNIRVSGGELRGTRLTVEFVSDTGTTELQAALFSADNRTVVSGGCA
jgi:hypothetical protein